MEIEDGIVIVCINWFECKNVFFVVVMNGLIDVWEKIEVDDSVCVVILILFDCGVFSVGMDLKEVV